MDPLSVTASIVGILAAAQQVSAYIGKIVSTAKKAPEEMLELKAKIDNVYAVLVQLQALLLGQGRPQQSRTAFILVDQVMIALCACVVIFSKLNTFVSALENDVRLGLVERIRWALKADEIKEYLQKLDRQESSLSLILTILTCESNFEARSAVDRLEDAINSLLQSHERLRDRLGAMDGFSIRGSEEMSETRSSLSSSSGNTASEEENTVRVFGFQDDLDSSRVYQRVQKSRIEGDETFSLYSKSDQTMAWSMMSGMSLSEISNIGVLCLPVAKGDISNSEVYQFGAPDNMANSGLVGKRMRTFLASNEYDIEDWNIKVKIGAIGVTYQMVSKNFTNQDLIWVIPCVGDIKYPVDKPAEPFTIWIAGESQQVKVQYHAVRNIIYVLLDSPIFRERKKALPYPDPEDSTKALFYSLWNQSIAKIMERFQFDIYFLADYRSALALLYLLPRTVPCCFCHSYPGPISTSNLEWDARESRNRLATIFCLDKSTIEQYLMVGFEWNLLYMTAKYLALNQNGTGYVSVGDKANYDSKSESHRTVFASGIREIIHLPFPDPSDTSPFDETLETVLARPIDREWESRRPKLRVNFQEWAGLEINPTAELFVFIGRWEYGKGIDLIADVMRDILAEYDNAQLVCIGPVADEFGKRAATDLTKLMRVYPRRVYIKPEFTTLPPYCFSGAEFTIIPSRYDPIGLVAIEFCRKGALVIGPSIGGLGRTPGFWYKTKSWYSTKPSTDTYLQRRLKRAIRDAMSSSFADRQAMRAAGVAGRFPVQKWVEEIDRIQGTAIRVHSQQLLRNTRREEREAMKPVR